VTCPTAVRTPASVLPVSRARNPPHAVSWSRIFRRGLTLSQLASASPGFCAFAKRLCLFGRQYASDLARLMPTEMPDYFGVWPPILSSYRIGHPRSSPYGSLEQGRFKLHAP